MEDIELKNAYVFISAEMDRMRSEALEHDDRSLQLRRKISQLGAIVSALKDYVCMTCGGRGEGWVNYAQDDTKMEKCTRCKGTGLARLP